VRSSLLMVLKGLGGLLNRRLPPWHSRRLRKGVRALSELVSSSIGVVGGERKWS